MDKAQNVETKSYRIRKESHSSVPLLIHAVSQQAPKAPVKDSFHTGLDTGRDMSETWLLHSEALP